MRNHKHSIERAKMMLEIAAEYIEDNWPEGIYYYDETDCDGYCVAEDCKTAASELEVLMMLEFPFESKENI